ncbi:hypothetical protein ILUMI_21962 [Ignelater luminosus]|uniref:Uncharacterized protein n=1 Tax=Ignelater luminosus TaxID=2038154 RepID=A0A8K0CHR1_IGNLU|nr:hypothetical protein ILUMI_21962 [Ignelater luminosus]
MVNYYHEEKGTLDFLRRKESEIPEMSNADLKEFLSLSQQVYDINVMKENALQFVTDKLNKKKQEFEYCDFIIDNTLFVLWAHLDYYMLRAIPRMRHGDIPDLSTTLNLDVTLASASEATWKVSADDISNLKQGLVSIFNDSFSRQLMETAQQGSDVKKQFVENLLRKIKRLIQFVPVK